MWEASPLQRLMRRLSRCTSINLPKDEAKRSATQPSNITKARHWYNRDSVPTSDNCTHTFGGSIQ
jgi:hypothetical protein